MTPRDPILWPFVAYCLVFEVLVWGLAGWACLTGHSGWWLFGAAFLTAGNDHLKLKTWREESAR